MKKIKLFLAAIAAMVGLGANAQLTDGSVYWIQDAGTGQFISQGDAWATKAVAQDVGGLGFEAVYVSDGVYKLNNIMWNTVKNATVGLGVDVYVDQTPAEWTITASGDGYTIKNGDNYLVNNGEENAYKEKPIGKTTDAAAATVWKFLTKTEYDAAIQAYKDGKAASYATSLGFSASTVSALEAIILDANQFITKDYTSNITNSTLGSNDTGWTHGRLGNRGNDAGGWAVGSGCAEFWNGCGYATQTVGNLPNGLYKVSFVGSYRPANSGEANNLASEKASSPAFVYANEAKVEFLHWIDVPAKANGRSGITVANGYQNSFYTYVTNGTLALGVVADGWTDGYSWCTFGQFTLTYYSDKVSDEDAAAIIASIPTSKMSDAASSAITSARTTFEANKTIANYNALNAAITAAQTSVKEYAIIDAGVVPSNDAAGWAKSTTNGDLACNTWSTEGNSDGSGMTTPFIQDWVGSGTPLAGGNAGGKLYYTFTDLNPGETYVVTARVRVFNEAGTGVTGATYFVGDNSKSLETFGSACLGDFEAKGRFAVLSCAGTVDANGDLQFGIELADNSPINWMSIKDVTIAAGTGDVPTSIALNESSLSLTTGSTANLTATITPASADDKTILWTSSDETVATVAGGSVVALKAGTATITANAYAGTSVTASCTVTVADATAPAFYSTEIVGGTDYYIMNAVTGQFLGGANDWGTRAGLIEHGIPFGAAKVSDGVYTLDSYTYNNANDHFVNGIYVDGASTNLYITPLTDGKFSISTADGSAYMTGIAGSTIVANTAENATSAFAQWYFLSKADRDKMLASTPADATYYVKQANISRNRSAGGFNVNAWSQYNVGGTQDDSNFAAQVYNASVDNYQIIEGIPNGTYTVSVQAFTSGSDVKFYANDQKVDVKANDSGVASCSDAAALFKQGLYPNTVTVTVTDRTLKIGFEGDCSGSKWLCYDDVTLYMTAYTANTGVTASNIELQIGENKQLVATTNPETASFNAITSYTSNDESIATVDANGVVTGVAVGETTITVTANEMENFSTTVNVTVTLVAPTALALSETEITLDEDNQTATLSVVPTPDGANTSVDWTSSDVSVATVNSLGEVTAVLPGTATITATSLVAPEVSASATVTVTFPETKVSTYANNGATRTIYNYGPNLIKNGSFEYPDAYYGWTVGTGNKMTSAQFTVEEENGDKYIQSVLHSGSNAAGSLRQAWPIEAGKKYVFGFKVKNVSGSQANNNSWMRVSLCNANPTAGDGTIIEQYPSYNGNWTDFSVVVDNTESNFTFVQAHFRWLGEKGEHTAFDDFYLCEVLGDPTTEGNVQYALDAIPTANIGTGAFQYSQDAIDAANALEQGTATVAEVEAAYEAVTTLNVPEETQAYNLVFNCDDHSANGNALTLIPNPSQTQGLYGLKYLAPANENLAQAFYFVHTTGNKYKVYAIDTDLNQRYITTQAEGYGTTWYEGIRTIDDASKAMEIEIRPNGEGLYLLWNIGANKALAHNGNSNNDLFTNNTANFQLVETTKPSITINTTAAGWGTVILPFAVASLPEGVKAYSVSELKADQKELNLEEVHVLEANKPYIIEGAWEANLTGDAQGTALTYTDGLLTGVYAEQFAPAGKYVLQKINEVVAFYRVAEGEDQQPKVKANRAYLTDPNADGSVKAFFFPSTTTAIQGVFSEMANGNIYDLQGRKVQKMQKGGIYVINGHKVTVK